MSTLSCRGHHASRQTEGVRKEGCMRKFIGLVAVIAFLWVAAVPAQALTLPNATQTVSAKLYDQTSFFDSGTPRKPANVGDDLVAVGDEVRAVFDVTQFDGLTTGAIYSNVTLPAGGPADLTEELAGLLYDMEVKTILLGGVSVTDLTLGVDSGEFEILLKAGGRLTGSPTSGVTNSGGRLDLWDDPTLNNLDVRTASTCPTRRPGANRQHPLRLMPTMTSRSSRTTPMRTGGWRGSSCP